MKYSEKIYESLGDSPEAAVNGSYRVQKSTNVTEIFSLCKRRLDRIINPPTP